MLHPSRKNAKKSRAGVSAARLRRALFDTQRARGRASVEVKLANRAVLLALLADDQKAAIEAREREDVARREARRCRDLCATLEAEMLSRGISPLAPDLRWAAQVIPGLLRAVCDAIANGERAAA
jgi:hypothetical protein